MRGVIMVTGIAFCVLGVLMLVVSGKNDLPAFTAAVFGFGLIISGIIICLLTVIIIELKKLNKPH